MAPGRRTARAAGPPPHELGFLCQYAKSSTNGWVPHKHSSPVYNARCFWAFMAGSGGAAFLGMNTRKFACQAIQPSMT
jgi:hypothetical protein